MRGEAGEAREGYGLREMRLGGQRWSFDAARCHRGDAKGLFVLTARVATEILLRQRCHCVMGMSSSGGSERNNSEMTSVESCLYIYLGLEEIRTRFLTALCDCVSF